MKKNYPYIFNENSHQLRKHPSAFRIAVANLTLLLSFVGFFALIFTTVYFGIGAGMKQMDIQTCKDFQSYNEKYPNQITQDQKDICEVIGIEIK